MKDQIKFLTGFLSMLAASPVFAGYNLGTSTGGFSLLTNWMQSFVNFMDGPYAIAVIVVSLIVAAGLWIWAPKSGAVGIGVRIVVAAIVVFNIGAWIATF